MCDKRRVDPSLTEAELARSRAAYPDLEINRDASGIIVMSRKQTGGDDYGDWLLSQRGTVSPEIDLTDDSPRVGTESQRSTQDTENLQALEALRDRLTGERETAKGAQATALNIAIRALSSAIDILDSVIAHEQGMPQKKACRDRDTYDQRREFLNDAGHFQRRVSIRMDPTVGYAPPGSSDTTRAWNIRVVSRRRLLASHGTVRTRVCGQVQDQSPRSIRVKDHRMGPSTVSGISG